MYPLGIAGSPQQPVLHHRAPADMPKEERSRVFFPRYKEADLLEPGLPTGPVEISYERPLLHHSFDAMASTGLLQQASAALDTQSCGEAGHAAPPRETFAPLEKQGVDPNSWPVDWIERQCAGDAAPLGSGHDGLPRETFTPLGKQGVDPNSWPVDWLEERYAGGAAFGAPSGAVVRPVHGYLAPTKTPPAPPHTLRQQSSVEAVVRREMSCVEAVMGYLEGPERFGCLGETFDFMFAD